MKVIDAVAGLRAVHQETGRPLGLVPTMGYLHEGHRALVRRARSDNATVAVSIFVNPAQFGLPYDDFSTYPRDMESDLAKLREEGVDLVFAPSVDEMYPDGFETSVDVGTIANKLEGKSRPGHFTGVATVVCKLLSIVRPDRAYFGQKDAQQCLVVQRLTADLDLGAEIVVVPTVREADGLALSSRNSLLDTEDNKRAALVLYRSLCLARELWRQGEGDAEQIRRQMRSLIESEPLARIDYLSIAHSKSLEELEIIDRPALVSLAVWIGQARLIDNILL
jgi:pantoate--beta-alanine ligase